MISWHLHVKPTVCKINTGAGSWILLMLEDRGKTKTGRQSFIQENHKFPKVPDTHTHTHGSSIPCGLTTVQTYGAELCTIWPRYKAAMHSGKYSEYLADEAWCSRSDRGFSPEFKVQRTQELFCSSVSSKSRCCAFVTMRDPDYSRRAFVVYFQ